MQELHRSHPPSETARPATVLQANAGKPIAIDPAPHLGDPAFDVIDLPVWHAQSLDEIVERADALGQTTGMDPDRISSLCSVFGPMFAMDVAELPDHSDEEITLMLELAELASG